jgi:hypothetical protein
MLDAAGARRVMPGGLLRVERLDYLAPAAFGGFPAKWALSMNLGW